MAKVLIDANTLSSNDLLKVKEVVDSALKDVKRRALPSPQIFDALEGKIESTLKKVYFAQAVCAAVNGKRLPGYNVKPGKSGGIGYDEPEESKAEEPQPEVKVCNITLPSPSAEGKAEVETLPAEPPVEVKPTPTDPVDMSEDMKTVEEESRRLVTPEIPPPPPSPGWGIPAGKLYDWGSKPAALGPEQKLIVGQKLYMVPMSEIRLKTLVINVLGGVEDPQGDVRVNEIPYTLDESKAGLLEDVLFFLCDAKYVVDPGLRESA